MPSSITDRLNGQNTSVAIKPPCLVATVGNVALSGLQTIDDVTLTDGVRVLVRAQDIATDNGVWVASASDWTRAVDFNGSLDVVGGTYVSVISGNLGTNSFWRVAGTGIKAVGVDALSFERALLVSSDVATFQQAGLDAVARSLQEKAREAFTVTDFGAASGSSVLAAANAALSALGTTNAATLTFPKGTWVADEDVDWSSYRNVTFRFEPGAVLSHGEYDVVLPEKVEATGANFSGTGSVTTVNLDAVELATPPLGYVHTTNDGRGVRALGKVVGGTNNFARGVGALGVLEYGHSNIAVGNDALGSLKGVSSTASAYGTFMGQYDGNVAIGDKVLAALVGPSGTPTTSDGGYENTAVGLYGLLSMQNGRWNVCLGAMSQLLATSGEGNVSIGCYNLTKHSGAMSNNIAIGFATLEEQTSGSNTAVGHVSMNANVNGSRNATLGAQALELATQPEDNTVIGQEAFRNATGNTIRCTVLGAYSGGSTTAVVNGLTAIGYSAALAVTGPNNTAVGVNALTGVTAYENCTGLGAGATVTGSNQLQLGNSSVTPYAYGALQIRSDARDKADIRDTVLGLSFINALRPVDFRWDMRDDYRTDPPEAPKLEYPSRGDPDYQRSLAAYEAGQAEYRAQLAQWDDANRLSNITPDGTRKRSRFHHGLIAQEVKSALDQIGVDCAAYQDHSINGGDDVLSIGYEELIGPLIKAVQELSARVEALES